MSERLEGEATAFATTLTQLMRASFGGTTRFDVLPIEDRVKIGPGPFEPGRGGFQLIPMYRSVDPPSQPARLWLKVQFDLKLDDAEQLHLMVLHSTFGLWVQSDPLRSPRPVARTEYDREARSRPAAHLHLHAESVELGWVFGTAGRSLPRQSEIHFPVGGRRFRPSLEELLLFLNDEELFTDWVDPNWRAEVENSLNGWQRLQLASAVRNQPSAAVEELVRLGYTVTAPDTT